MRVTLFTLTIICCHMKPTYSISQFETETDFHIFVPGGGGGGDKYLGCCSMVFKHSPLQSLYVLNNILCGHAERTSNVLPAYLIDEIDNR